MYPTSPVDICNLALDHLSQRADIASIETPQSPNEVIMARHYDLIRQGLLREYIWHWSKGSSELASTGSGAPDFKFKYRVPNDLIRIISIGSKYWTRFEAYDYIADEIYVNPWGPNMWGDGWFNVPPLCSGPPAPSGPCAPPPLLLRYVKNITDVSLFDPLFVRIISLKLAMATASKITGQSSKVELLEKQLQLELPKAIGVNAQDKKPKRIDHSQALRARIIGLEFTESPDGVFWVNYV